MLIQASETYKPPTREAYLAKKADILAHYDHAKELRIGDKLVCKQCKDEKTLDMPERNFFTRCCCRCEAEAWEKQKRSLERPVSVKSPVKGLPTSFSGAAFRSLDFTGASARYIETADRCERFVTNFDVVRRKGRGLWLYGGVGTGKTFLSACIVHGLEQARYRVIYALVRDVAEAVRASYKSSTVSAGQVLSALERCDCLVLDRMDDLTAGSRVAESFAARTVCDLIRTRYENAMPTVFVSRHPLKEFCAGGVEDDVIDMIAARSTELLLDGRNRRIEPRA